MKVFVVSAAFFVLAVTSARQLTVYNSCSFTIWPAMFTSSGTLPNHTTGWEATAGTSVTFTVPDDWNAGRIWARRDCDFSVNPGPNSCLDGGCSGGLVCNPNNGTFVAPATLAEFALSGTVDYVDVSLVDGFNLPMRVDNTGGCATPSCPVDLIPNCPVALQGPFNSSGFPVGCMSACEADLDGAPQDSANCCTGSYETASTCPPSGVAYYAYFKENCPDSVVYVYDPNGISPLSCIDSPDYTVTFCPSS